MTLASSSISPSSLGSPPYPTLVSNQPPRLTGAQPCAVSLARPAPRRLLHHPGLRVSALFRPLAHTGPERTRNSRTPPAPP